MKRKTELEEKFIALFADVTNFERKKPSECKMIYRADEVVEAVGLYAVLNKFGHVLNKNGYKVKQIETTSGESFHFPKLYGEDTYYVLVE